MDDPVLIHPAVCDTGLGSGLRRREPGDAGQCDEERESRERHPHSVKIF
jgi:hypothetical protein